MTDNRDELMVCPFCGGEATLGGFPKGMIGQVYCKNEDCFGPRTTAITKRDSIRQWNTRASASAAVPVAVKPLEWISCADYTIHDDLCLYEIEQQGKDWRLIRAVTFGGSYLGHYQTLDAAKAAAQADYEQRIRSALTATPRPLPSVDELAETVHKARWPAYRQMAITPFADADDHDREYCRRIATAILTLLGGSAR